MNRDQTFVQQLRESISGEVLNDDYSLGMYSTDASIYQIKPLAVLLPKDESDVKKAVKIAYAHKIKILPRGAGTSLAGQTVGAALVIDFSRYMNRLLELNKNEKWVRVQPGIVLDELNSELSQYNLHFSPDPATSSRANIGGMIGNNSSGTKSIRYGKTVDHILELKILLADGTEMHLEELSVRDFERNALQDDREGTIYRQFATIIKNNRDEIEKRFPKVMRRVGGYNLDEFVNTDHWNLSKLVTGSEGTLATVLEAKLKLDPLPKHKSVAVVHFSELEDALRAVKIMLDYNPAAIEILDRVILRLSKKNLTTRRHSHFIVGDPAAVLITEFYGDSPEEVMHTPRQMFTRLEEMGLGYAYPLYPEGSEYDDVWIMRKKGLGLMLGIKGEKKPLPFIEDAAIPIDVLAEYISRVLTICKKYQTDVSMYAHASVGVIHVRPILDLRQRGDIENLKNIANETFELVMEYGGSWSGEHGDGLVRSAFNERFFGHRLYQAFKEIKRLFDPDNLMNPGKIVEAQAIDENLRYGINYVDQPVKTEFKYRTENSFRDAVHMCTGVGECRKMLGGTMCPSFKATRDEEHSTRGRANALRLAMSGQLNGEGKGDALSGQRLHQVLDLCLSCKACKSECPSNVDMAKMKSDVLQIYYDANGTRLRDRLIRDSSGAAARLSGVLSVTANYVQKSGLFRSFLEKITAFDRRRILPSYARVPFYQWFKANNTYRSDKKVVLFADTFLNFHEPDIGIAALRLLNSCGYEVLLAEVGCCQRPKISHGFLRKAKKDGMKTAAGLKKYLDQDLKIVVCEPSCASALNDDLPDLVEDEELANSLKENIKPIDVFLAEEVVNGHIPKEFKALAGDMLIHGHCHQKALYGTKGMKSLCELTGHSVEEIPSGCCGMAGSFGYEKEHYEISGKIGEMVLFPVARNMSEDTVIVANGFSCRHQIEHFTGKKPKHWVEVIRAGV